MDIRYDFSDEISYLKSKYPEKDITLVMYSLEDAVTIYRNHRNTQGQTEFDDDERNWIRRCASQLLNLDGYEGFSSYSENGYSFKQFERGLSPALLAEIFPKAKVFDK